MHPNENMRIKYKIPVTRDKGPCTLIGTHSTMETCAQNALWQYNRMREHDGQRPLAGLPRGTTSEILID